ncbi:MAG: hypothetical protein FD129_3109, partial [bacterium]
MKHDPGRVEIGGRHVDATIAVEITGGHRHGTTRAGENLDRPETAADPGSANGCHFSRARIAQEVGQ